MPTKQLAKVKKLIAATPPEWKDGRLVLKRPTKNTLWATQSQMSKHRDIPTSLFRWFASLLPEDHLREVDYGYYEVQEMTEAAAGLLIANREVAPVSWTVTGQRAFSV